ncbi:Uncharacterized protein DAT39_023508 [Clarias magur]|uniref:Uncharacterized protein n=1 Tax=Clarias magur TaxID=1594786 RepID=A0A8J4T133_CLAMG|nr:Uncharacterized protein DAT39_023575 [Clarias magur]KAF5879949.1 Uncharacterized protein DAT39_023549 [Clarias magur]KAF5879990.1 Uncharacterized protein DAT39_023508 [Clarias magur]
MRSCNKINHYIYITIDPCCYCETHTLKEYVLHNNHLAKRGISRPHKVGRVRKRACLHSEHMVTPGGVDDHHFCELNIVPPQP